MYLHEQGMHYSQCNQHERPLNGHAAMNSRLWVHLWLLRFLGRYRPSPALLGNRHPDKEQQAKSQKAASKVESKSFVHLHLFGIPLEPPTSSSREYPGNESALKRMGARGTMPHARGRRGGWWRVAWWDRDGRRCGTNINSLCFGGGTSVALVIL